MGILRITILKLLILFYYQLLLLLSLFIIVIIHVCNIFIIKLPLKDFNNEKRFCQEKMPFADNPIAIVYFLTDLDL